MGETFLSLFCSSRNSSGRTRSVPAPDNMATAREARERGVRCKSSTTAGWTPYKGLLFNSHNIQTLDKLTTPSTPHRVLLSTPVARRNRRTQVTSSWYTRLTLHLPQNVKKHSYRYCPDTDHAELHKTPLHIDKLTVWRVISSVGSVGPYFFGGENKNAVQIRTKRHVTRNMDSTGWRDSPPRSNIHHRVKSLFHKHVSSRNDAIPWPEGSSSLTDSDFSL